LSLNQDLQENAAISQQLPGKSQQLLPEKISYIQMFRIEIHKAGFFFWCQTHPRPPLAQAG